MKDSWINRFQFQFIVDYKLIPKDGWKKWLFDLEFNLVLPNRPYKSTQKPLGHGPAYYDFNEEKNISRYLWLSASVRILGLDVGAGIFWRKKLQFGE